MKSIFIFLLLICGLSNAQISINLSSRPSSGTSTYISQLRLANTAGLSYSTNGANQTWDFSTLVGDSNYLMEYKSPTTINPAFALSIPLTSFGYKILDSLPLGSFLPISIKDIYSFFQKKSSTNTYNAMGRGFFVSGFPLGSTFVDDDELFHFPMTYSRFDSSTFEVNMSLATVGTLKQKGYRLSTVDGWGTIKTPKYPSGIPCLRMRSVVREIDSIKIGTSPSLPLPRNYVEYSWLSDTVPVPIMQITTNLIGSTETITSVTYRDNAKPVVPIGISAVSQSIYRVYPNPTYSSIKIEPLTQPTRFILFSSIGELIAKGTAGELDLSGYPSNIYFVALQIGDKMEWLSIEKK